MKALVSIFVVAAAALAMSCAGNANKAAENAADSVEVVTTETVSVDTVACDTTACDTTVVK